MFQFKQLPRPDLLKFQYQLQIINFADFAYNASTGHVLVDPHQDSALSKSVGQCCVNLGVI